MITVHATREGLLGHRTATGYDIEETVPFVALPSSFALRQWIHLLNPINGKTCWAMVLDLGPWNTEDHGYVLGGLRPQAEGGKDLKGRVTNRAGIDLGERVWRELGMTDNGPVTWSWPHEVIKP